MILGLDLGTRTGWCLGTGATAPALGSITMPDSKEDIGPFADFFAKWLSARLDQAQTLWEALPPKEKTNSGVIVCFEAPLLPGAKLDRDTGKIIKAPVNIATTRKLQGLAWEVEKQCYARKLACREEFLQTIKKGLTGSGKADKLDMERACRRAGLSPKTNDESDAFGVWLVAGVRHYAKRYAAEWDRRIYSTNR